MSSLYEINQKILEVCDPSTGEITDWSAFEALQLARDDKLENIALWYKNLLSDAAAFKAEKDAFAAKQKAAESKAESLKNYLDSSLKGGKFKTVKVDVSYRKSTSVEVVDESLIPAEYMRTVTTTTPDKAEIAKALKVGEAIDGVQLKESQNIQIK